MTESHATIVDGTALAEQWLADIAVQVRTLGVPLHLAAVCADDDPGLKAFVKLKKKAAEKIGVAFSSYYPESELEARQTLVFLAKDENVHGIFVELPLPDDWNRNGLLALVPAEKDVDVLTRENADAFHHGTEIIRPPTVSALARVFGALNLEPSGLSVAVVGQGELVGKPIAHWLRRQGSEVAIVDVETESPETITEQADLLVTGTGVPELVNTKWVKEGATVIDFGYAKRGDAYVGDVSDAVRKKAGALTPVPGGMGPLVIAATLENLLTLATR